MTTHNHCHRLPPRLRRTSPEPRPTKQTHTEVDLHPLNTNTEALAPRNARDPNVSSSSPIEKSRTVPQTPRPASSNPTPVPSLCPSNPAYPRPYERQSALNLAHGRAGIIFRKQRRRRKCSRRPGLSGSVLWGRVGRISWGGGRKGAVCQDGGTYGIRIHNSQAERLTKLAENHMGRCGLYRLRLRSSERNAYEEDGRPIQPFRRWNK